MKILLIFIAALFSGQLLAQISDASFFPSMKTINPSVAHMRTHGFIGFDLSKKNNHKDHEVTAYGLTDGIKSDVELKKATLYRAGKGPGITFEAMFDQESGTKEDTSKRSTDKRTTISDAKSTFYGGNLDLKYFGLSYAKANYNFLYKFRVGEPPSISAHDIDQKLEYTNLKLGSAIKIGFLRLGGFLLSQKSSGNFKYTYYDPNTGNKGSSEDYGVTTSANGYGIGLGSTFPNFRMETSLERMYNTTLNISKDYPDEAHAQPTSSRLSFVGELKFTKIALGVRVRKIKGNFTDLEDIISSNLLYSNLAADDSRLETTFNFGFGISKGFSFSAFYTQSKVESEEVDPINPSGGEKYPATTTSKAMGLNLSYVY